MALSAFALVATVLLAAWPPDREEEGGARDHGADEHHREAQTTHAS
jgi:hypothetical protein